MNGWFFPNFRIVDLVVPRYQFAWAGVAGSGLVARDPLPQHDVALLLLSPYLIQVGFSFMPYTLFVVLMPTISYSPSIREDSEHGGNEARKTKEEAYRRKNQAHRLLCHTQRVARAEGCRRARGSRSERVHSSPRVRLRTRQVEAEEMTCSEKPNQMNRISDTKNQRLERCRSARNREGV